MTRTVYDSFGRPVWTRDGDGYIDYTAYDQVTGAVVETITDVNTNDSGEFSGLPSGWASPSTTSALNLITTYVVDGFGRTVQETDPNGNVIDTLYDDPDHAVFTFTQGNKSITDSDSHGTMTTVGPISMTRDELPFTYTINGGTLTGSYSESLTFSGTLTIADNQIVIPDFVTAGTDHHTTSLLNFNSTNVSGMTIQSLSRSLTSAGSQLIETDSYYNISNATYLATGTASAYSGSATANFYATTYDYDSMGRQARTTSPTGTITDTTYDVLGREVGTYIGTDDTIGTNNWEAFIHQVTANATNVTGTNMTLVSSNQYDNGGIGDSNLTETTEFPGGGQANRTTTYLYDWRDRQITTVNATASGVHTSLTVSTLDNLGEATGTYTFDNLSGTITLTDSNHDGVPDSLDHNLNGIPTDPDLDNNGTVDSTSPLRALTMTQYDEQGRVFQTTTYNVNQTSGSYATDSNATIVSQMWFDHRGDVVETASTEQAWDKMQYDGAGRLTASYVLSSNNDTSWADALNVTGDTVMQETQSIYDGDGNVVLSIDRTAFDGDSGVGALLGPSNSANQARVTYTLNFYDAADRLTATVDLGTNNNLLHGSGVGLDLDPNNDGIIDIPGSAPTASTSTLLMTSYSYDAAGNLSVTTDPRGIKSKTFYDQLGQTTYTVANWNGSYDPTGGSLPAGGTANLDQNQTVAYTYGSDSHMIAQTILMPSDTPSQTTGYLYGVTTIQGSAINSNDLLRLIEYPRRVGSDAGQASTLAGDQESFTYDALGETLTHTLQNGLKHTYGYDVLGRTISDNSSGSGINQTVSYGYDALGNVTSTTDANGNTTSRVYDGFGRLTEIIQPSPDGVAANPTTYFFYDRGGNISLVLDPNFHITVSVNDFLGRIIGQISGDPFGDGTLDGAVNGDDFSVIAGNWGRTDAEGPWQGDMTLDGLVNGDDFSVVADDEGMTGSLTTYFYLVDGNENTMIAPNGNAPGATASQYTTTMVLDRFGRTSETIQPSPDGVSAAPTTSYTYDNDGNVLTITDPLGNVSGATASFHTTTIAYDGLNRKISQTSPVPNSDGSGTASVTSWTYDLIGNMTSMTDPNGNRTTYTYDSRDFLTTTNLPAASTSSSAITTYSFYDNDGNLIGSMDGNGVNNGILTMYVYDQLDRLVKEVDGDPYGDANLDGKVDSNDAIFVANFTGQSVAVPLTMGDVDFSGNVDLGDINTVDGQLGATGGAITTYTYDADGNMLTMVSPQGNVSGGTASLFTTTYTYDHLNRKTSETDPDPDGTGGLSAPVTTYTYDADGNMLTLTDPTLNVTTWTYDRQNRVTSETNQTGHADSDVYDANGNLIQETDRDGRVIVFAYDRDNRLLSENYSGSSIAFAYSVNGMVTAATDSSSGTMETFAYDNLNRLISENTVFSGVSGTLTQSWGYDRDSNITSYSYKQNGTTVFLNNYTYDAMSRLILLAQADGGGGAVNAKSVSFTYNADSQYDVVTKYHDLTQTSGDPVATTGYTYDSMNRLTKEQSNLGSGPSMLIYNQSYNIASQIIALSTIDGTSDFTYDNDGQLQTVSAGAMPSEDYSYDASGNRDSTGYTTGSDNQMTAAPNIANTSNHYDFAYDHEGNTTDRYLENGSNVVLEHDVYTWDFRNRMTEVQDYTVSGTASTLVQTINLGYDAFDERVSETVTNNTASAVIYSQKFIYDGDNLSVAVDATTLNATQVFFNGLKQDEVFAQDNVGTSSTMTLWANGDGQGSVRDVLNNSGSVVNHNVLSSFGAIVSQSSVANSMVAAANGMLWDSFVKLYYDNARWYDSGFGRFYSVDPIGFKSGQTNLYEYCADAPINHADRMGTTDWTTNVPFYPPSDLTLAQAQEYASIAKDRSKQNYSEIPMAGINPDDEGKGPPTVQLIAAIKKARLDKLTAAQFWEGLADTYSELATTLGTLGSKLKAFLKEHAKETIVLGPYVASKSVMKAPDSPDIESKTELSGTLTRPWRGLGLNVVQALAGNEGNGPSANDGGFVTQRMSNSFMGAGDRKIPLVSDGANQVPYNQQEITDDAKAGDQLARAGGRMVNAAINGISSVTFRAWTFAGGCPGNTVGVAMHDQRGVLLTPDQTSDLLFEWLGYP